MTNKTEKIDYSEILGFVNTKFQLDKVIEINKWHNKESVYKHSKQVLNNLTFILNEIEVLSKKYLKDLIGRYSKQELFLLVPIFHDIGKVKTIQIFDGKTKCPKHEQQSTFETGPVLKHLGFEGAEVDYVQNIVKHHGELNGILNKRNDAIFLAQFDDFKNKNKGVLLELCLHMIADTKDGYYEKSEPEDYEFRIKFANEIIAKYYPAI